MKKLFCLMLMAVATVLFVSCNKITENKLIGKWNVVSWQERDISDNSTYENADYIDKLIFYDNGQWKITRIDYIDDPTEYNSGKWYLDNDKLHFYDEVWDVEFLSKKEVKLHCVGRNWFGGFEETFRLRKAN